MSLDELEAAVSQEVVEVVIHLNGRSKESLYAIVDRLDIDADRLMDHLDCEPVDKGGWRYSFIHFTVTVYP